MLFKKKKKLSYRARAASSRPSARWDCGRRSSRPLSRSRSGLHGDTDPADTEKSTVWFWNNGPYSPSKCGPGTLKIIRATNQHEWILLSFPHISAQDILLKLKRGRSRLQICKMRINLLMILKDVLCHWMRAKRRVIFVGFADYSGLVVKTHLQIKQDVLGKMSKVDKNRADLLQRWQTRTKASGEYHQISLLNSMTTDPSAPAAKEQHTTVFSIQRSKKMKSAALHFSHTIYHINIFAFNGLIFLDKAQALLSNVVAHCEQPSVVLTAEEIVPLLPATYPFTN